MRFFKNLFHAVWLMHRNIRHSIRFSTWCYERVPGIGRFLAMFIDRTLVWRYGLEVTSHRVKVAHLHIPHPVGVLLGGNGIVSEGRVAVMSGAKFVGRAPDDPEYLARAKTGDVFRLGDNVMIGTNSVIVDFFSGSRTPSANRIERAADRVLNRR